MLAAGKATDTSQSQETELAFVTRTVRTPNHVEFKAPTEAQGPGRRRLAELS
jgi:hypothetical protein